MSGRTSSRYRVLTGVQRGVGLVQKLAWLLNPFTIHRYYNSRKCKIRLYLPWQILDFSRCNPSKENSSLCQCQQTEKTAPPIGSYILALKIFLWEELEIKSFVVLCKESVRFTSQTLLIIRRSSCNSPELWAIYLPVPQKGLNIKLDTEKIMACIGLDFSSLQPPLYLILIFDTGKGSPDLLAGNPSSICKQF